MKKTFRIPVAVTYQAYVIIGGVETLEEALAELAQPDFEPAKDCFEDLPYAPTFKQNGEVEEL